MIHAVKPPNCRRHLMWIVYLQLRLLRALCDPLTCPQDITEDWVKLQLERLDPVWLTKWSSSSDKIEGRSWVRRTMLEHMALVAGLDSTAKTKLLDAVHADLKLLYDMERGIVSSGSLQAIESIVGNSSIWQAIRGLFETFYNPQFYASHAYLIPSSRKEPFLFHKEVFLSEFYSANRGIRVCPLCDGPRSIPQVDHFYPKSEFPFFSCHPLNLVPICRECNMAPAKGVKVPLDKGTTNIQNWFHPYLNPLADWTHFRRPSSHDFRIVFARTGNYLVPTPESDDPIIATYLRNLDGLINLKKRWIDVLISTVAIMQQYIYYYKLENGHPMSREELSAELQEQAKNAHVEIGIKANAILEYYYYTKAAQGDPDLFDELWAYNIDDRLAAA